MSGHGWRHFCLILKNRPSTLVRLTRALTHETIAVEGMTIASIGDRAAVQFLAPSGCGLGRVLRERGFRPIETPIFRKTASCHPLKLHRLVQLLGKRRLSLLSFYGAEGGRARMIVKSEDSGCPDL
jgi:hypothetical protein